MSTRWSRLAAAGLLLMALGCAVAVVVPAGIRWDFANFYDAGAKARAGQIGDLYDPAASIAGRAPQGAMKFWGAPISAYFYAPFAGFAPATALVLFKLVDVAAIFAALLLLYAHTRRFALHSWRDERAYAATFVWLALAFQPLWTIFRVGGQTTPWVLLLLVVALICHGSGRMAASAACFAAAVLVKPALAPGLALLALVSGLRFFAATFGITLAVSGLSVLVMGWPIHRQFLEMMLSGSGVSVAWMHNSALAVPLENLRFLGDPTHPTSPTRPPLLDALVLAVKLLVLALFGWLLATMPDRRRWSAAARRHCRFVLAVLFALLVSPVVWEHYLSLLFIPLIYVVASYRHFGRPALWLVGSIFFFALGQNLVLVRWVETSLSPRGAVALLAVGLLKSAPLWLTMVLLWRHKDELWRSYGAGPWARAG